MIVLPSAPHCTAHAPAWHTAVLPPQGSTTHDTVPASHVGSGSVEARLTHVHGAVLQ